MFKFFIILSRQDTNSRPAVQEAISNPALVWSDIMYTWDGCVWLLAINLQWLRCIADIAQKWLECSYYRYSWYNFFLYKQILPKFVWGKISCVGVDGGLDTFIHSLRRITIEGTYPDMLSCTWKMFINNNIHQAQVVQVHITLLGEGAEQNKFHPASI